MLTHRKLIVYEKAVVLWRDTQARCAGWSRRHAVVDHFRRASESIVLNIAEGARLGSAAEKAVKLDYALGSALECAACLDILLIKGRLNRDSALTEKRRFLEITRMLIGLRKAWLQNAISEESVSYSANTSSATALFHHETLDMYKVGLAFMHWFVNLPGVSELSDRLCREMDKTATSAVLNLAEGNGRYSELDHRRFLELAAASAVKTAAYLDLYQQKVLPTRVDTTEGQEHLARMVAMLSRF